MKVPTMLESGLPVEYGARLDVGLHSGLQVGLSPNTPAIMT